MRKIIFLLLVLFVYSLTLFPACNNEQKTTAADQATESLTQTSSQSAITTTPDSVLSVEPTSIVQEAVDKTATTAKEAEPVKEKTAKATTPALTLEKATVTQPENPKTETPKPSAQSEPVKPVVKEQPLPPPVQEPVIEKPTPVAKPVAAEQPGPWPVPAKAKSTPNPIPADKESLSTGKALYVKHCGSCHGKSGAGDGTKAAQLKTPLESFRTSAFQSQTDGSLFYKIWEGREDMPSYKKKIPDRDEVWSIVNYLRTMK